MFSNQRSFSNPIYEIVDQISPSVTKPLLIEIENDFLKSSANSKCIPLLLLANCLNSPVENRHNYVNQRIEDFVENFEEENFDPLYARPRKRCITLEDDPIVIPAKTVRPSVRNETLEKDVNVSVLFSILFFVRIQKAMKSERAQLISTKLPVATVLASNEQTDEIDQFIARENDRLERVKLRRRQNQNQKPNLFGLRTSAAFNNPNYVEMPKIIENEENPNLGSIVV